MGVGLPFCPHNPTIFFFFNDTATTEIYTLSLHDALPICASHPTVAASAGTVRSSAHRPGAKRTADRKSTRLNSSHGYISYAVFCLKKKSAPEHLVHALSRARPRRPAGADQSLRHQCAPVL